MRNPHNHRYAVLGGLFMLSFLVQAAGIIDYDALTGAAVRKMIRPNVQVSRSQRLRARRDYTTVLKECQRRINAGEDVTCPNINDAKGVEAFMKDTPKKLTVHPAAASGLRRDTLNENQEHLLRQYERAQYCPPGLNDILPGFGELCSSLITGRGTKEQRDIQRVVKKRINAAASMQPKREDILQKRLEQFDYVRPTEWERTETAQ